MAFYKWYGPAVGKVFSKQIDWVNDTVKVALVKSTYTPNQDTHDEWADVSANEATGTGYTAGGVALTSKTLTYNSSNNWWTFDAADTTFPNVTVAFRYAVFYDDSVSGKPLIAYLDFGSNQSAAAEDLTLKWDYFYQDPDTGDLTTDAGILRVQV
jgi:hypothetical protein